MRKQHPVSMSWIPLKNGVPHKVPYIRDHYLNPIDGMIHFLLAIAEWKHSFSRHKDRAQSYKSFVDMYAYGLKSFTEFLSSKNLKWTEITDKELDEFFNWEVPRILTRSASKKDIKTAQRTCNNKLRVIYQFYGWAYSVAQLLPSGYVGENGRIKTTIPLAYTEGLLKGPLVKVSKKGYPKIFDGLYPLLRDHVGSPVGDYSATQEDIDEITEYFYSNNSSDYIANRNTIILAIADQTGLRSNSIASLTTDQFNIDDIEEADADYIDITPSQQKLGYTKSFAFDLSLASRIIDFIAEERAELMRKHKINERKVGYHLFLTEQGKPMTPRRISDILTNAFKAIGHESGKGAGAHSFRRKKARDTTNEELAWRARHGMPIDPETVSQTVATTLGQRSRDSAALYHKSSRKMRDSNLESRLARQNAELLGEIHELRREKAHLELLIRKKTNE